MSRSPLSEHFGNGGCVCAPDADERIFSAVSGKPPELRGRFEYRVLPPAVAIIQIEFLGNRFKASSLWVFGTTRNTRSAPFQRDGKSASVRKTLGASG